MGLGKRLRFNSHSGNPPYKKLNMSQGKHITTLEYWVSNVKELIRPNAGEVCETMRTSFTIGTIQNGIGTWKDLLAMSYKIEHILK